MIIVQLWQYLCRNHQMCQRLVLSLHAILSRLCLFGCYSVMFSAEVDPSLFGEIFSDVSNLIESARHNMSERISDGEELTYKPFVGINKHVDGRGQCFLHSRRILHGIIECLVLQHQKLLNRLVDSPTLYLGLETAQQVMLKEQGIDVFSIVISAETEMIVLMDTNSQDLLDYFGLHVLMVNILF